jgi:hypothetical protein
MVAPITALVGGVILSGMIVLKSQATPSGQENEFCHDPIIRQISEDR